nr:helix-turn-helix transcriptional regulator [Nakamurella aerolata]
MLRDALGETLRDARTSQNRTLRDVSTAANVSLGYLSEVERGRKEASSELLASICVALELELSDVLTTVSEAIRTDDQAKRAVAVNKAEQLAQQANVSRGFQAVPANGYPRRPVASLDKTNAPKAGSKPVPTRPEPARAAARPERPLRIVVPFSPAPQTN